MIFWGFPGGQLWIAPTLSHLERRPMDLRRMAIFIEAHTLQAEVLWEEQHLIGI